MQSGKALDRIYLNNKATGEDISRIRAVATKFNVPINYVPVEKLNGFNIEDHEGCVAIIYKVQYQDLEQLIPWLVEKGEVPLFIILMLAGALFRLRRSLPVLARILY